MEMEKIIKSIYENYAGDLGRGKVADYIPPLAKVSPDKYAISVCTVDGKRYNIGDYTEKFSIQSISKVFTLAMLAPMVGKELWESVGKEPSGSPFNSLVQLEYEKGIPRNPFINAGALVITDKLVERVPDLNDKVLEFVRGLAGDDDIFYNREVAASEYVTGERNKALAHLMKSFGNFKGKVSQVISAYCHHCSIEMSTEQLAKAFLFLANGGVNPLNGEVVVGTRDAKRINAIMLTCGFYDESGDFAYRVGMPGKSGVGGGIVAVIPGKLSIAVWSPELNVHGNSYRGIATLADFTTELGISVF
ncbi:MAG: glutaminase [Bacteroidales bacterium]|jgi:glutaminase|nr:glutaminase [Bacteroidales bacterium]